MLIHHRNIKFGILVFWLCLGPIGQANSAEKIGDHSQANSAHKLQPSTDAMVVKNSVDNVSRELEAERNKPETATETRRAEQELKAQKDSATWAMVMGLMAIVSTIVGAAGLIFLIRTVQYTKEATLHAKATLLSGRAWMIITEPTYQSASPINAEVGYIWRFDAINAGSTPALKVKYRCEMELMAPSADITDIPLKHDVAEFGKTVGQSTRIMGPPRFITITQVNAMARGELYCIFRCLIEYRDVYEPGAIRETDAWFKVYVDGEQTSADGKRLPRFVCEPVQSKEERII
jgi:hypothetical protein